MVSTGQRSYGWLAFFLAVLLIIVTYLWITARTDLRQATNEFQGDLGTYSSEIIRECNLSATTTQAQRAECEQAFEGFGQTLRAYGKQIVNVPTTTNPLESIVDDTPTTSVDLDLEVDPNPEN